MRARICFQRDIQDCNIYCLTETWFSPDGARRPRSASWYSLGWTEWRNWLNLKVDAWVSWPTKTGVTTSCSPDLEHLTLLYHPFYLPREFSLVLTIGVYNPPHTDTDTVLSILHVTKHISKYPDTALIVARDFNKANLISCPIRGGDTLDHCYTPFKYSYKASSLLAFGKAKHAAIVLMPVYRQKHRQVASAMAEVRCWSAQSEAALQDMLSDTDWAVFRLSSGAVDMFMEVVTCFIFILIDDICPMVTVKVFPNQKPRVDWSVRKALNASTTAYNNGLISSTN